MTHFSQGKDGSCPHTPEYPDLCDVPTLEEATAHCKFVEGVEEVEMQRALTSKDGETTRIDKPYWDGLSGMQRAAVVAHERGHPEIGMRVNCEGCADKMGGYYMRAWGYAPHLVTEAFSSLNVKRRLDQGNIGANAQAGAAAADASLAARGLLGVSPTQVTQQLQAERARRITAVKGKQTQAAKASTTKTASTKATKTPRGSTPAEIAHQIKPPSASATPVAVVPPAVAAKGTVTTAPALSNQTGAPTLDAEPAPQDTVTQAQFDTPSVDAPPSVLIDPSTGLPPGGDTEGQLQPNPNVPHVEPDGDEGTDVVDQATAGLGATFAGDAVAAILGETARPHTGKVLIGAGIAVVLAVGLVIWVRRS